MQLEEVTIIGAGPGGIATAIQLKRSGIQPLLMEKSHIGGLLVNANLVENYPGFPRGIPGADLATLLAAHLNEVGVVVHFVEAMNIDHREHFIIETGGGNIYSRIAVIASGTRPRLTAIDIAPAAAGRIFHEIHPIIRINGKRVAIIGAGDAAFDYALSLGRRNEVTILNRGKTRRCLPLLWERAAIAPSITYLENAAIGAINSSGDGLLLNAESPAGKWQLPADYVVVATGRVRQLDYFPQGLMSRAAELQRQGLLYFVGDVTNDIYRQTSIAVGDGVHAAMKIYRGFQGGE